MEKKRSVGVKICSVILLGFGLLLICWVFKQSLKFGTKIFIDTLHFIILTTGILSVAISISIYMLQEWARKLCVIFSALNSIIFVPLILYWIIGELLSVGREGWGFFYAMFISPFVIIGLYLLIYLTRPKVKEQFK